MSNEEQGPAAGSVPLSFGNALAWKWVRSMPTSLRRGGFLTLLYALRAMANASGELRFHGDRKPIRIRDLAAAAGVDEKDARRYLEAGVRAGVVTVLSEPKRGRPTLYAITLALWPDWDAAAAHLESTKRVRPGRRAAPWVEEENGGRSPELEATEKGGPPPELPASSDVGERGTAPRMGSGDRPPFGSGDRPPNNPGITQEVSQEGAEAVVQPQVVGATGSEKTELGQEEEPHDEQPPADGLVRCGRCRRPMIPRPGRDSHRVCPTIAAAERNAS